MVRDLTDRPRVGRADPPHGVLGWSRHILPRVISYLTNDVINRIPVFRIRHAWYRSVLGLKMGHGTAVYRGCYMTHYGPRSVRTSHSSIGCNTIINRDCTIDVRGTLTIGSNVSISPEVAILTAQHQYNSPTFALEHRDVVIGDNVWIGMRAMILPGAQIGHGAVVAAGAVVTGRVPPLTLVAGVPARPIAARDEEAARYFFDSPPVLFE